ncbi:HAD-superfamily hydrolase, subfamily IA, variant 3 OS=Tsukamurella paurometabola (strain ATCC 8368/ DSM / CCUG 35730 / CIP 100753 / JCM 10117 / KCTC 9821/ NBRC 16120 / NCIMB 702349 / NCTC 13040) OX=521096 GN=Tpau_2146 PE=4 SV=1 [Tsukamurella paurometabola]|uniref:HAD-superfamily hydrolase, subfamily IA, variant 3 n=1 Tax=Tsukamurella paurometabola (strain ATCC 8368 / DSM 20162 / CCUG 35730 / CIP 100753 / JCM 10117 / KCTC 9821 / NBRC 16120 / NCIMB 702349 / NCTC 13040) TaxID=521096 RepID=D5UPK1_TSUPD|nr:HAD family phosphatase [Tsukamurella paurometabola]ADG78757.1 HAD-superfamily hydrolase, subfamily IA, variant 3 [Tsukamurella paurometabola DSM 20162]SUP33043.1 Phosphorylated carbohydrates phosphatase TM_1254 [Tsukamurella paurometabola]
MSLPSAVLFDMDGTLLDSEKLWDIAVAEFTRTLGTEITAEAREATLGNATADSLRTIFDFAEVPEPERDYIAAEKWVSDRVVQLFDGGIPWQPGARDTLDLLAEAGVPLVLVTNTIREITEHALGTLGRERFVGTVCGDEIPNPKPAADPYLRGAELAGVPASECIAVEDSPTGARSALAAGCAVFTVGPNPVADGAHHLGTLAGAGLQTFSR